MTSDCSPDDDVAPAAIRGRVHSLRGTQVMLDADLADLYGVRTGRLMEQVRRNRARFPPDFAFELTDAEIASLRSQNAISSPRRGGRRHRPHAFTEQGAAMLSGVLRSDRAIAVNVEIMRTFVEPRRGASAHAELERRLDRVEAELRARADGHDADLAAISENLRALMAPAPRPRRQIGFAQRG